MASYTDQILTFNPYIKQVDDTYATVGMMKQEQYNQGVQKIQSYVDSVNGIQVARNIDKQYIDKKLNNLTSAINSQLAGADFSNQALVAQVGGHASSIANDERVRNAVSSTMKMKSDVDAMNTAKKEGKGYAIQNEMHLMKDVNSYMQGGLDQSYQSEGYIPYVDVDKRVQDLWKDMKPNSKIVKSWTPQGGYGYAETTEHGTKWISEEDVMQQISSTLDPSAWKQLSIDAEYRYRGADINELILQSSKEEKQTLETESNKLLALAMSEPDPEKAKEYTERVQQYCERVKGLNERDEAYRKEAQVNPQAVVTNLYAQNWLRGTAGRLSYTDDTVENRAFMDFHNYWLNVDKAIAERNKKAEEEKTEGGTGAYLTGRVLTAEELSKKDFNNFKNETATMQTQLTDERNKMLFSLIDETSERAGLGLTDADKDGIIVQTTTTNPKDFTVSNILTVKNPKRLEEIYTTLYQKWQANPDSVPQEAREFFQQNSERQLLVNARKKAEVEIGNNVDKLLSTDQDYIAYKKAEAMPFDKNPSKIITEDGKTYNFNTHRLQQYLRYEDEHSLLVKGALYGKETEESLRKKYGFTFEEVNALRAADSREGTGTRETLSQMRARKNAMAAAAPKMEQKRAIAEKQETQPYESLFNPRQKILNYQDAKGLQTISNILGVVSGQYRLSGQDRFAGIDWESVQAAITDDERKNTAFSYFQKDGQPYISITNTAHTKGVPIEIPIDVTLAQQQGLYEVDRLETAKKLMTVNHGRTGNGVYEAIPIPRTKGVLEANNVKYEVKKMYNDKYKLSLYINGEATPWVSGDSYTDAELNQILFQRLNDTSIKSFKAGTASTPFGGTAISGGGAMNYPGFPSVPSQQAQGGMPNAFKP